MMMTLAEAIDHLASTGEPFTPDDVLALSGHPDSQHRPNGRNNAIGIAFRTAHSRGLIEPVGITQSKQKKRKGGMVRIWQGA